MSMRSLTYGFDSASEFIIIIIIIVIIIGVHFKQFGTI